MTTFSKLRNLVSTLRETKAELDTLAAVNSGDSRADSVLTEATDKISSVIDSLEERQKLMLEEEPQFREEQAVQE